MKRTSKVVKLKCDFLLDQGVKISGLACINEAEFETRHGALICRRCIQILKTNPERLKLPYVFGQEIQERIIKDVMNKHLVDLSLKGTRSV